MSLYIVLAGINGALWLVGMISHVGPAVHLFAVAALGMYAADQQERRQQKSGFVSPEEKRVTRPSEPICHNPLFTHSLLTFGSTMRTQSFLAGVSLEQQSARLVVRSQFQQHSTRAPRGMILEAAPNSTAQLVI